MPAVAMTDHGNLAGTIEFFDAAKKAKIKPIYGCDIYLKLENPPDHLRFPYTRLVLLAMDNEGFHNLRTLISRSYLEGRANRPLVDRAWLTENNKGLIALSGGLKGEIAFHLLQGREDRAMAEFQWLHDTFGDRFYAELQENNLGEQTKVNEWLLEKCKKLKVKPVATSDVHYLNKDDALSHEVFILTQLGRILSDANKRALCSEFWFKDQETMQEQFAYCPEALENTKKIAERCNVEFKFTDAKGLPIYHLPKFEIPKGNAAKNAEEYLANESAAGLAWRFAQPAFQATKARKDWPELEKQYRDRLNEEIQMIHKTGFSGYFLIVSDFIRWAKSQRIPVGPGRGSGAGSVVAWALQIIDVDPIPYNLLFERFINPERVSLPDFDVDFCQDRRGEVIEYVRQKYGKDQVSQIITFGRMQTKQCIRDVGRVLGMPYGEVDQLAKLVPDQLGISLQEALDKEPKFTELRGQNPTIEALFTHALKLEGLTRSFGKHAGGVIITDQPLVNYAPLLADEDGAVVVQFDKDASEKVGLVKFDFLGLKTLTHIQKAVDMVNEKWKQEKREGTFRIEDTGVDDAASYALIAKGDTAGVFQVESSGMTELCKKIAPANLEELTWINALFRPGPLESGMAEVFVNRKHGRVKTEYVLPQLEEVLKESLGVFIYQEQVMRAARVLAGYSLGEADLLRRAMGKKKPEEMAKQKERFVAGARERNISAEKANEVFDLMEKFSGYGFNKSHGTAYAYVSYQTAYLKAHYPAQFYAALLTTDMSDTDKLAKYISDAKDHNIDVLGPDVNQSHRSFRVITDADGKETIRFGLEAVKGLGESAVNAIIEEREANGNFRSFGDFCRRMAQKKSNKKTIESLIRSGGFDALIAGNDQLNRATLFGGIEVVMSWAQKQSNAVDTNQGGLFEGLFDKSDGPVMMISEPPLAFQPEWNHMQRLEAERELLGFYVSGHPLDPFKPLLHKCITHPLARIHELNAEGKIGARKPDDWKNRRKGQPSNEPRVGGIISAVKEITTKKGDRMAFVALEDFDGKIEVVCFPKCFEKYRDAIRVGNVVVIAGQIEGDGRVVKVLASSVESLELVAKDKLKTVRTVVFQLDPASTSKKQLEDLLKLCKGSQGACSGVIEYTLGRGIRARYRMADDLKFSPDYNFVQGVKEIFGRDVLGFH